MDKALRDDMTKLIEYLELNVPQYFYIHIKKLGDGDLDKAWRENARHVIKHMIGNIVVISYLYSASLIDKDLGLRIESVLLKFNQAIPSLEKEGFDIAPQIFDLIHELMR